MTNVTDLIIRIKNGYMAKREKIESPHTKLKEEILKKLVALGYVKGYKVSGDIKKVIDIELIYENGIPALTDVRIYSKPGRRWYVKSGKIQPVLNGMGYSLLSTPHGVLSNIEARKKKTGGELLFAIW